MKNILFVSVSLLLLFGCRKDEEIIKGSIAGNIYTYDQSSFLLNEQSGVDVKLYNDTTLIDNLITDSKGQYTFEALPYGKYRINVEKEGFVQTWETPFIYHIGGKSPTFANYQLYEIPTYELSIDSIVYDPESDFILIYVKFNGDTILPSNAYGYHIRIFAGSTAQVDKFNYLTEGKAYLTDYDNYDYSKKGLPCVRFYEYNFENFNLILSETLYLRLYPLAMGQGYWVHDYFPEALGPPSENVIEFNYNELVGD